MISAMPSLDLYVSCVTDLSSLTDSAHEWNRLADDVPFRRWEWVESWWRHYRRSDLSAFVLTVRNHDGVLVGLLPCYRSTGSLSGSTLRFMGSGEICSDYLSLLTATGQEQEVAAAVGRWLSEAAAHEWSLIDLDGVAQPDAPMQYLLDWLRLHGHRVHIRQRLHGWRLKLPAGWEEYLTKVSRGRRVRIRQIVKRQLETGQVVGRVARSVEEFERGWQILCDLHQRRRISLGEKGCFVSDRFARFHEEISRRFFEMGKLRLHWVELEGVPVAVDYAFLSDDTVYCYQSGFDPRYAEAQPGWLNWTSSIRKAIEQGYQAFDFMRGDEPYKATWRAEPIPLLEIRIIGRRPTAVLRDQLWHAGRSAKNAINVAKQKMQQWLPNRTALPLPEVETDAKTTT